MNVATEAPSGGGAGAPPRPGQPVTTPAKPEKDPAVTKLEKEIADLKARTAELDNESKQWHGRYQELQHAVNTRGPRATETEEPEPDEEDEPVVTGGNLLDELGGENGVAALVKRGLLTKKEAKEVIEREARRIVRQEISSVRKSITRESQLTAKYPDLNNENSELFKEAGAILRERANGDPKKAADPDLFEMAIELAAERVKARRGPDQPNNNRTQRIAAQQGDQGGRVDYEEAGDDEMTPQQQRMLERFNEVSSVQISPEKFKKRAKDGVRLSGASAMAVRLMTQGARS